MLAATDRSSTLWSRLAGASRLAEALLDYPFRRAETIARAARDGGSVEGRIAAARIERRVVSVAGADAHANVELRGDPGTDGHSLVKFPGYEPTFRAMSVRVTPDRPLTGDAAADARLVLRAIRNGHLYTVVDGLATPPSFDFTATNDLGTVHEGDELGVGGPVTLHVRSNVPAGFVTTVFGGAGRLEAGRAVSDLTFMAPGQPDAYSVVISQPDSGAAWLRSNPIYIRGPEPIADVVLLHDPPTVSQPLMDGDTAGKWRIERDDLSQAALDRMHPDGAGEIRLRWGLAGGGSVHQYVSLVIDTPDGVAGSDRLAFTVRAERPMRVSVQLRGGSAGQRWQRSVFVPAFSQERTVYFDDLRQPVGSTLEAPVDLASVRAILFVIDTTNTKPGASGRLWMKDVRLQR